MWKTVDSFVSGRTKARKVVSAVLSDEDERCTVDARHLNVRVPDMLLRTCEREIQRVCTLLQSRGVASLTLWLLTTGVSEIRCFAMSKFQWNVGLYFV